MTSSPPPANVLQVVPPPWTCKFDTYWMLFNHSSTLPDHAYSPLEQSSPPFSDPTLAGEFKGGSGMIQICRYKESPVGTYNELLVMPGFFDVPAHDGQPKRKYLRITRIYVDQKNTTYNGRRNWNIPKHLARFTFSNLSNPPRIRCQVFSADPTITVPFFSATIQPFRWAPSFRYSTRWSPYMGLQVTLVQPPLPASGKEDEEELCGTDKWASFLPQLECKRAQLAWVETEQPDGEGDEEVAAASCWPKIKPWKVGMCLEDSDFVCPAPDLFST